MLRSIKRRLAALIGPQRVRELRGVPPTWGGYHRDGLREESDPTRQNALLLRHLRMVEIEVHSRCNRRCWFCPNALVDRRSDIVYMPEAVYLKVMGELAALGGWRGTISYSRYNEPFADEILYTRIAQARAALPLAHLSTNTNGDYLTPEAISRAAQAGLNRLSIQYYMNQGEWTPERALAGLRKTAERLALPVVGERQQVRGVYLLIGEARLEIELLSNNWDVWRLSRGGTVVPADDTMRRRAPCTYFWDKAYIDYNGAVMPCCNLRSDIAGHERMILGNVAAEGQSLRGILCGARAVAWRRRAARYQNWAEPCATCEAFAMPDQTLWRAAWRLRQLF
jgi:MoaA/NifB/PqqE/SkfB family radical SAM enzyme